MRFNKLERFVLAKLSSLVYVTLAWLFEPLISIEENEMMLIRHQGLYSQCFSFLNLRMLQISLSVLPLGSLFA
jgi:hypothetical protein